MQLRKARLRCVCCVVVVVNLELRPETWPPCLQPNAIGIGKAGTERKRRRKAQSGVAIASESRVGGGRGGDHLEAGVANAFFF